MRRGSARVRQAFVGWCWQSASLATQRWIERLQMQPYVLAHDGYRAMWNRCNAEASLALVAEAAA